MKFKTLVIDPPWDYITWGPEGKHRSPDRHYAVLTAYDICRLSIEQVSDSDAVCLLWSTWPHIPIAMKALADWGFTYKTGFPWLKLSRNMIPRMGTGYHARACTEPLLIGTKGSPPAPEPFERMEGVMFSKLGPHSAKPDDIYERAELYDGPYLEIFARPDGELFPPRPGWTFIGNEITGRDIRDDLRLLAETDK